MSDLGHSILDILGSVEFAKAIGACDRELNECASASLQHQQDSTLTLKITVSSKDRDNLAFRLAPAKAKRPGEASKELVMHAQPVEVDDHGDKRITHVHLQPAQPNLPGVANLYPLDGGKEPN